ncbi:unnamed protein product [Caenorhabditis bovis]|uniref:5'-nucleotidase n=1 Tax=Caenorhabditis bovis TaxID=2654633 RepID=A0A8S1ENP4_9PELO|nr:unnamed protein product [Caenorhabditis bovis]
MKKLPTANAETLTDPALAPLNTARSESNTMLAVSEAIDIAKAEARNLMLEKLKKSDAIVTLMEELKNMPNVRIANVDAVETAIANMTIGGSRQLLVISDFDYTLSRFHDDNGVRLSTTHGVFDDNVMKINPELGQKFIDLRNKYYPIEFDPKLTPEQKTPMLEAWWRSSHNLIIQERFSKSTIEDFVSNSRIVLRDGAEDLILTLDARNIPLVIFSAGIGNIIEYFLQKKLGALPKNTHFISNMILFDEEDKACAFSEPLIHTFCKNSSVIQKEASFFHEMVGRNNVLLLGDSMGDIHMDVGVEKDGPTLKVGFYNGSVSDEDSIKHYIEAYDIVIIHDNSFTIPQRIIDVVNHNHNIIDPTTL